MSDRLWVAKLKLRLAELVSAIESGDEDRILEEVAKAKGVLWE